MKGHSAILGKLHKFLNTQPGEFCRSSQGNALLTEEFYGDQ